MPPLAMMGRHRKPSTTNCSLGGNLIKIALVVGLILIYFANVQTVNRSPALLPSSGVKPSTKLAFDQSFGFFDDLTDEDWKMRQEVARKHRHHSGDPLQHWNETIPASMYYFNHYEPLFACPHLLRVGGPSDGPKWTCDPYRIKKMAQRRNTTCLVYSIGCANIYLWEDGLYDLLGPNACEFHIFDPGNFDRPVNKNRNMHYHNWGMKSSYQNMSKSRVFDPNGVGEQNMQFKSFPETLRLLGHEHRTIDLLKVDCEHCEWFSYRDWINHGDIRQLFVETHSVPHPKTSPVWPWPGISLKPTDFFDDLQKAGFMMFSKEPNTHVNAKGNYVEWSFIKLHRDFLNAA